MALTFHHHQLPNGLDIIAESNPDAHSIGMGLFVKTGARDEEPGVNGVSHFLEHMMFKGSKKYTWQDVNRIFDELGARYNAFTSQEMTAYWANVLPEFTQAALEHLSHLLRPALRQEDFDTEKKVILEEISMYLDDPGHRLYEALMAAHFAKHPLAQSILGSAASVAALQRDQMAAYFARRYGPGNMVLAAAGQLDFARIVALAEEYCGSWPHVEATRRLAPPAYAPHPLREMVDPKLNRQYTMALMPAPSSQDPRRFVAHVLADVIGDSEGSRLYWALVDNAIAEDADLGFMPHDGCGSYYLALTTDPDRAAQALEIAHAQMQKVKTDLSDDEVQRAKNKIASSIVIQGEVPMGRLRALAGEWTDNRQYRSLKQDLDTIVGITTKSLRDLMTDFPFAPQTIVTLGPRKK